MVKRSSSKRAYKKRRTVRKSRVIRRRKTARSKTLRGGMKSLKEIREDAKRLAGTGLDVVSGAYGSMKEQIASRIGPSGSDVSPPLPLPGPSPQDSEAKARADAATAAAATKRAAADAAAGVVNERQDELNRKISEIKRMNTAFTANNGVGWTPNPNSPDAKAFEALQQSKNRINTKLTEAKTAAAAAEAAAVAAEAAEAAAAEAGY